MYKSNAHAPKNSPIIAGVPQRSCAIRQPKHIPQYPIDAEKVDMDIKCTNPISRIFFLSTISIISAKVFPPHVAERTVKTK